MQKSKKTQKTCLHKIHMPYCSPTVVFSSYSRCMACGTLEKLVNIKFV